MSVSSPSELDPRRRVGRRERHAEAIAEPPALPALDKLSKKHQDGLLSLLSDAMARRRNAIRVVEEEAAEAEGGEWLDG